MGWEFSGAPAITSVIAITKHVSNQKIQFGAINVNFDLSGSPKPSHARGDAPR
jgi:hypothetical protein